MIFLAVDAKLKSHYFHYCSNTDSTLIRLTSWHLLPLYSINVKNSIQDITEDICTITASNNEATFTNCFESV